MKSRALIDRICRLYKTAADLAWAAEEIRAAEEVAQASYYEHKHVLVAPDPPQVGTTDRRRLEMRIERISKALARELAARGTYSWWSGTFFVPTSRGRHDVYRNVGRSCETGGVKDSCLQEWHPELIRVAEAYPFPCGYSRLFWPSVRIGTLRCRPEGTRVGSPANKDIFPYPQGEVILMEEGENGEISFWAVSQEEFACRRQWGGEIQIRPKVDQPWEPTPEQKAAYNRWMYGDATTAPVAGRARGRR